MVDPTIDVQAPIEKNIPMGLQEGGEPAACPFACAYACARIPPPPSGGTAQRKALSRLRLSSWTKFLKDFLRCPFFLRFFLGNPQEMRNFEGSRRTQFALPNFPRNSSPFCSFCFFGVPLFSTHQAIQENSSEEMLQGLNCEMGCVFA